MRPLSVFAIALFFVASCNCDNCPAQDRQSTGGVVKFDPNNKVTGHDDGRGHSMYRAGQ
jgi:hypothetical protein